MRRLSIKEEGNTATPTTLKDKTFSRARQPYEQSKYHPNIHPRKKKHYNKIFTVNKRKFAYALLHHQNIKNYFSSLPILFVHRLREHSIESEVKLEYNTERRCGGDDDNNDEMMMVWWWRLNIGSFFCSASVSSPVTILFSYVVPVETINLNDFWLNKFSIKHRLVLYRSKTRKPCQCRLAQAISRPVFLPCVYARVTRYCDIEWYNLKCSRSKTITKIKVKCSNSWSAHLEQKVWAHTVSAKCTRNWEIEEEEERQGCRFSSNDRVAEWLSNSSSSIARQWLLPSGN